MIRMRKSIITTLFVALFAVTANAQTTLKKVYNEDINPIEQIDQAIAKAQSEGKFVICQVLIGSIGTFVTGSATSANILFGKLQAAAAGQLGLVNDANFFGVSGNETNWIAAANCAGSEGGKLISPQSIAIATAACDMEGQDGDIMRKTLPFAIFWILMNGLMVFLGLHVI